MKNKESCNFIFFLISITLMLNTPSTIFCAKDPVTKNLHLLENNLGNLQTSLGDLSQGLMTLTDRLTDLSTELTALRDVKPKKKIKIKPVTWNWPDEKWEETDLTYNQQKYDLVQTIVGTHGKSFTTENKLPENVFNFIQDQIDVSKKKNNNGYTNLSYEIANTAKKLLNTTEIFHRIKNFDTKLFSTQDILMNTLGKLFYVWDCPLTPDKPKGNFMRRLFEKTATEDIVKKYPLEQSLTYLSFGAGRLFQDFCTINQLLDKNLNIQKIILIDLAYQQHGPNVINLDYLQNFLQQFLVWLNTRSQGIEVVVYTSLDNYFNDVQNNQDLKPDLIFNVDTHAFFKKTEGLFTKLLSYLKKDGTFYYLSHELRYTGEYLRPTRFKEKTKRFFILTKFTMQEPFAIMIGTSENDKKIYTYSSDDNNFVEAETKNLEKNIEEALTASFKASNPEVIEAMEQQGEPFKSIKIKKYSFEILY